MNEIECLQTKLDTLDQNIQNEFQIKNEALKRLTALSLENAVSNNDKTKEQEIEEEIRS